MKSVTVITFDPDGTARCLWTEAVPLHELGRLEVRRATTIEFNNANQHWAVKDRKGKVRFFARSRSTCLEWEQHNLQPK
jgi:FMN phosphatase YigB (HAD superfamily)